jgi:hypothetical protein
VLFLLDGSAQYTRRAPYNAGMNQDHLDEDAEDAAADARAAALAAGMLDQLAGATEAPQEAPAHPYSALNPECVLDAVDSVGLRGDGRLLALNSYENRVYQVGREDDQPVVVKFYRPGRWSDAAILEEHGFTEELAAPRCRWCRRWCWTGRTLHDFGGFRFAVFAQPRRPRARAVSDRRCWSGSGASSAASTRSAPPNPTERPALNRHLRHRAARLAARARFIPPTC